MTAFAGSVVESLEFSWYSPRYEKCEIPPEQIWMITTPLTVNTKNHGEFRAGKFLAPGTSFFENAVLVENLKNAIEQSLAKIARPA
jgi:hypothetical protein